MPRKSPSFTGLQATPESSAAKSGVPGKATRPERLLRAEMAKRFRRKYRLNDTSLPGKPDITFPKTKIAIFCDGDFWHGRDWLRQRQKLEIGANGDYWMKKIAYNMHRDRRIDRELEAAGWRVLRFWESEIVSNSSGVADVIEKIVLDRESLL